MKTIVKMQFGSHVYGTSLPTSDTDYKAVHIPDVRDILLQRVKPAVSEKTKTDPNAKNTADDVDFESFPLQHYMKLLLEGQTIAVDMLFTPKRWIVETSPIWEEVVEQKELWLHRGVSAFVGYCRQQAAKYGIRGSRVATVRGVLDLMSPMEGLYGATARLGEHWGVFVAFAQAHAEHAKIVERLDVVNGAEVPVRFLEVCGRKVSDHMTLKHAREIYQKVFDAYGQRALAAEKNQGVDWKALMHAVRVIGEAEELLMTGQVAFPRPDAPFLLQVRKGELPYKQVAELIEEGVERVEKLSETSKLREKPDRDEAEEFVLRMYGDRVYDVLQFGGD